MNQRKKLIFGLFIYFAFFVSPLFAEEKNLDKFQVRVRLLQASEKSLLGFSSFASSTNLNPMVGDSSLEDLKEKLEVLPFENYRVLSSERVILPLRKQITLTLENEHSVTLKPLALEDQQVAVWLNWKDQNGSCLLDSRMHFDLAEPVLLGTDSSSDDGLLLAINFKLASEGQR